MMSLKWVYRFRLFKNDPQHIEIAEYIVGQVEQGLSESATIRDLLRRGLEQVKKEEKK